MKVRVWLALTGLWLLLAAGAAAEGLRVPQQVRPFAATELTVDAPSDGLVTIRLWDALGEQQPIVKNLAVHAGENTLTWDGTTYGGMPLNPGSCRAMAVLDGADGNRHWMGAGFRVGDPIATLHYALPSGEVFSHKRASPWFVDCAVTAQCVVKLEIYADAGNDAAGGFLAQKDQQQRLFPGGVERRAGRPQAQGGRLFRQGVRERRGRKGLHLPSQGAKSAPGPGRAGPTGPLLPAALDDASVWQAMTAPMVVVDIEAEDHQRLYAGRIPKATWWETCTASRRGLRFWRLAKATRACAPGGMRTIPAWRATCPPRS